MANFTVLYEVYRDHCATVLCDCGYWHHVHTSVGFFLSEEIAREAQRELNRRGTKDVIHIRPRKALLSDGKYFVMEEVTPKQNAKDLPCPCNV